MRVDVLNYINSIPEFWDDVATTNLQLSAFADDADMTPADIDREDAIVEGFNNKYFGLQWHERSARVSMAYQDGPEDQPPKLGVDTTIIPFIGCVAVSTLTTVVDRETAIAVEGMPQKVISFQFESEDYGYEVPINKGHLLAFDINIERPLKDENGMVAMMQNYSRSVSHLLRSRTFLALDGDMQRENIHETIEDTRAVFPLAKYQQGTPFYISGIDETQTSYLVAGTHLDISLPDFEHTDTAFRVAEQYTTGELCLVVTSDTAEPVYVPLSQLVDIFQEVAPVSLHDNPDVLSTIFDTEAMRHLITKIENRLNTITNPEEWGREASSALAELADAVPDAFFDMPFYATGDLYRSPELDDDDEDDRVELWKNDMCVNAFVDTFDIKIIDGEWRVVLPLQVPSGEQLEYDPDDEDADENELALDTIYVIPDRDHMASLKVGEDPDSANIDLISEFKSCKELLEVLITMPPFLNATREKQVQMIDELLEPIRDLLEVTLMRGNVFATFCCRSTSYRAIKGSERDRQSVFIAKKPLIHSKNPSVTYDLEGSRAHVIVPEILDDESTPFQGRQDFPLSGGLPMLVIDNNDKNVSYYIPLADVISLIPYMNVEATD